LSKYLVEHQDVQGMWYFGSAAGCQVCVMLCLLAASAVFDLLGAVR
jgi:hypothetical protein